METAVRRLPILAEYGIKWIEEPLCPRDESETGNLRRQSNIPVAGGENIMIPPGDAAKSYYIHPVDPNEIDFDIIQPDITKYAPLHKACELIQHVERTGKPVVPHFLGPAPGQAASLHFAAGCREGLAEWDINRNPLRTELLSPAFEIRDGSIEIPDNPGLGWQPYCHEAY
jgi:L-alanine-DL-glutamate epimerase-like enolase superfamily enzyme